MKVNETEDEMLLILCCFACSQTGLRLYSSGKKASINQAKRAQVRIYCDMYVQENMRYMDADWLYHKISEKP